MSQEISDQEDTMNFNISFFLPKELSKHIEGDDESLDNKNNIFESNTQSNNIFNQNNEMDFPKSINFNNYMELNQKKFTLNNDNKFYNGGNIFHEYIPKHKLINLTKKENFIPENGCFPENTNTNTNPNNSFIPNNNNNSFNCQPNNERYPNNNYFPNNNPNPVNFPHMPNNFPFYNSANGVNNRNNNFMINNNEYYYFSPYDQFHLKNIQETQNVKKKQLRKKKVIDEYTLEMFGRRGWICTLCNNFNYDTRKKCNKCHIFKYPKKIVDYLQPKINTSMAHTHDWLCKYCGNYNYAFRLNCNRCQSLKEHAALFVNFA